jgi:hypothetical protein
MVKKIAVVLVIGGLCCLPVFARVIYVAQDGSGDYATIQPAFDACVDYDTVAIGFGTFNESLTLSNKNHVVVMGSGIGVTTELTQITDGTVSITDCNYCELWSMAVVRTGDVGDITLVAISGTGNSVRRCHVGSSGMRYYNCILVDVGTGSDQTTFEDDEFQGSGEWWHDRTCTDLTLRGSGQIGGCKFLRGPDSQVRAISWNYAVGQVWIVTNCLFWFFDRVIEGNGQLVFENNVLCSVGSLTGDTLYQQWSYNARNGSLPGEHNIVLTVDPFVNVNAGDFHLSESSPCWDAGDPYIHDREARGHDANISDMGCYGGMTPFFDAGLPPFPTVTSLYVTAVVTVGDTIQIRSTGRNVPRY